MISVGQSGEYAYLLKRGKKGEILFLKIAKNGGYIYSSDQSQNGDFDELDAGGKALYNKLVDYYKNGGGLSLG
jgi:hypothetical protein